VEDTRIVLGDMASGETEFHCVVCHQFAAPLDGERAEALVPSIDDCGGCHEMEPLIHDFVSLTDPHDAVCGSCHNPHDQTTPAAAAETCASAGCHEMPESLTPFHRGLPDGVADDCMECHTAHTWVVDGDDCTACHTEPVG
jgi:hypothetical protein